jgi:putative Mg2+ transporter-C (MgtC) family protein
MELTLIDICIRLGVAMILGILLGLERLHQHKTIGMRVYSMVSMTTALFVIMSLRVMIDLKASPDEIVRMMGQLAVGIGFLGGGIIIQMGKEVQNITTAAALWVAAGIGVAAGLGYVTEALIVAATTLVILEALAAIEKRLVK